MKPIDIFITAYQRQELTANTIRYLKERTIYPYRLFLIDQDATNTELGTEVDFYISLVPNMGIHAAWNTALALAESEYFITSDNDIYVPDLRSYTPAVTPSTDNKNFDWLERLIGFMDERPDYGAISLHPHIFIGAAGIDPNDPDDVKERNMCGAVMRIMRRSAIEKAGGWEHKIEAGRNHEESTICSRLQTVGYKVGICSRIRAFHSFGSEVKDNGGGWGYPANFPPEAQKHNPQLKDYVKSFDNKEAYNNDIWMPL